MLSNAYFLAKFRFGTAENEPAKFFQNFKFCNKFANFAKLRGPRLLHPVDNVGPRLLVDVVQAALARDRPGQDGADAGVGLDVLQKPELKGSIGEGPNNSNFSDQSSVKIQSE